MSLPISIIPTLTGKSADRFIKLADEAYKNRGTIDFTMQFKALNKILGKSTL